MQAAILNLLADLQREGDRAYMFISHDLGVVRYLSDRIAVLYLGRLMEVGPAETVFDAPHHPYTEALLSAVPSVDGEPTDRIRWRARSRARPRRRPAACSTPAARAGSPACATSTSRRCGEVEAGHLMRCHIPIEELRQLQARAGAPDEAEPGSPAGLET